MNSWIFCGMVMETAEVNGGDHGASASFPVSVSYVGKGQMLWVKVRVTGRRAAVLAPDLVRGQIVTVQGSIQTRRRDEAGPLIVHAQEVVAHGWDVSPDPADEEAAA